jgi:D-xylose ABC transporter substrate-binding protein
MGGEVLVARAENDQEKQINQANELIKEGAKVLVVVPVDSEASAELVKQAHSKNVKVIAYDRIIKNCNLDFYITFDNLKVGEMQAEYLTRAKDSGKYAILGGDANDHNSLLLRLGQMNILQPKIESGDIKVVVDKYVKNWSTDIAFATIDSYLSKNPGELDAIVASNDNLATGAYRALEKHGMNGKVLLSGQDAELDACRRIAKGQQTMTVYKFIETLAVTAASTAVSIAKNEPIMSTQLTVNNDRIMVPSILLPSMIAVHNENIRMTVVADGYLDEKKIFE